MPGSSSGDSDDSDYYDNFEKYKRQHTTQPTVKLETRRARSIVERGAADNVITLNNSGSNSDSSLEGEMGAFERVKRRAQRAKERATTQEEEDPIEELADDLPTADLEPAVIDEPLESLLRSAKGNLDRSLADYVDTDTSLCQGQDEASPDSYQPTASVNRTCLIQIRTNEKTLLVRWDMNEPIRRIREEYAPKLGFNPDLTVLMGREGRYQLDRTPQSLGFSEDGITYLDLLEDVPEPVLLPLKVQMKGKRPFVVRVPMTQKFADMKTELCKEHGLQLEKVRLIFDHEPLPGDSTPAEMDMEEDDCIDLFVDK